MNCSSLITVDEDHDLICLCKGENGNPPPDVIWYDKNDNLIGQKEKEQKSLVLRSVTEADSGTYTCKAQSQILMDEKSIEVKIALNCKYYLYTRKALRCIQGPKSKDFEIKNIIDRLRYTLGIIVNKYIYT